MEKRLTCLEAPGSLTVVNCTSLYFLKAGLADSSRLRSSGVKALMSMIGELARYVVRSSDGAVDLLRRLITAIGISESCSAGEAKAYLSRRSTFDECRNRCDVV